MYEAIIQDIAAMHGYKVAGLSISSSSAATTAQQPYSIQIASDQFEPGYEEDERLVIDPDKDLRAGDRVILHLNDGDVFEGSYTLGRLCEKKQGCVIISTPHTPQETVSIPLAQVAAMHHIVGVYKDL